MEQLLINVVTPGWYPTAKDAESVGYEHLTSKALLEALKQRFDQSLLNRKIVYNQSDKPLWRIGFIIRDNLLHVQYGMYNLQCWDQTEIQVQPYHLLQSSLWYDVEHNEKNQVPESKKTTFIECLRCRFESLTESLTECQCPGDRQPQDR